MTYSETFTCWASRCLPAYARAAAENAARARSRCPPATEPSYAMKPLSCPAAPRSRCARPRACSPAARSAPTIAARRAGRADFVRAPATGVDPTAPAPSAWWHALNDRQLDDLITAALAYNPDLHAAQARLRASRAQLAQQRAAQLPKSSATVAAIRTRAGRQRARFAAAVERLKPIGRHPPSLAARAAAALFGRLRRNLGNRPVRRHAPRGRSGICASGSGRRRSRRHAGVDRCRSRQRVHRPARSTAAACAVAAHCRAAAEDARATQQRRARGVAADADIERLTTQVENTRASLIPLDAQVTESLDRLTILTGRAPVRSTRHCRHRTRRCRRYPAASRSAIRPRC